MNDAQLPDFAVMQEHLRGVGASLAGFNEQFQHIANLPTVQEPQALDRRFGQLGTQIERLDRQMAEGFQRMDANFVRMNSTFGRMDANFTRIDANLAQIHKTMAIE